MAVDWEEGIPEDELDPSGGGFHVMSPNDVDLEVLNLKEVRFYEDMRDKILGAYTFTDPSDLADLDRILLAELTLYRINRNLSTGTSDLGLPLGSMDQRRLHQSVRELSAQLQKDKDALGISKSARDKDASETVAGYLDELRSRALEFGIHRNKQAQLSIALLQEVISTSDTFLRANELERSKLGMQEAEDVLTWIVNKVRPQLDDLDTEFIQHNQRYWIENI
jgi:hypothetical protein